MGTFIETLHELRQQAGNEIEMIEKGNKLVMELSDFKRTFSLE
jgi:hypothetical protein